MAEEKTGNKIMANEMLIPFGLIIAGGMILSVLIGGAFFYKIRSFDNALSVTGSATKEVTSDKVKWISSVIRPATLTTLKSSYAQMAGDLVIVKGFLKEKNIPDTAVTISPIFMDEIYDQNNGGEKHYNLRQTFEINSTDVAGITELAKNTQGLIEKGVIISTQSLEYYYSKLPDERVALLSDAVKDAKDRASKLAESSGKQIGVLKAASSGVVQVLPPNSLQVSDYGAYDTSSIEKQIMVTVKASFTLK